MNIYFAGSIRGGRQDAGFYAEIVALLKDYGRVLTEHVADPDPSEDGLSDRAIYERDMAWLAEAEFVPHYRSERGSLGKVRDAIHHGKVDYVIDFIRWGAHRNLDGDCEDCDVIYVRVPRSRSLIWTVRGLASIHSIRLD